MLPPPRVPEFNDVQHLIRNCASLLRQADRITQSIHAQLWRTGRATTRAFGAYVEWISAPVSSIYSTKVVKEGFLGTVSTVVGRGKRWRLPFWRRQ